MEKNFKLKEGLDESYTRSDGFHYCLFSGGYIKPEKILANKKDIKRVQEAIDTIELFEKSMEDAGLLPEEF